MADRNNREVTFEILEQIAVLSEGKDGWKKEVTVTSWNGGPARLDIRSWSPDYERMTRGLTFTEEEELELAIALANRLNL